MTAADRQTVGRVGPIMVALVAVLVVAGCDYVVVPPEEGGGSAFTGKGWSAVATSVGPSSAGGLQVDLAITNETGVWSAMEAAPGQPAVLVSSGSTSECMTVVVGTGGHRLAPGFRMRGFVTGPRTAPTVDLLRVECAGTAAAGSKLELAYSYVTGDYDYYEPEANTVAARLEVALDDVAVDLSYPVAQAIDGVVMPPDTSITAINDVVLTLLATERGAEVLTSEWHAVNPGDYPTYVHIGDPPVIGSDGVIYGRYESPDIATVPLTPAMGEVDWSTEVVVPAAVTDLTMLLSVESKKQRLFVHYAIGLDE